MEELIRKVLSTLDKVDIKGKDNLDRMLGCMQVLEKIADAMKHNREVMNKLQPETQAKTEEG